MALAQTFENWKCFKNLLMEVAPDGEFTEGQARERLACRMMEKGPSAALIPWPYIIFGTLFSLVEEGSLLMREEGNLAVFKRASREESSGVSGAAGGAAKERRSQLETIARESKGLAEGGEDASDEEAFFMRQLY